MPVVAVGQEDPGFEVFPSCDQRIVERFAHMTALHVNAGADLLSGRLGFS